MRKIVEQVREFMRAAGQPERATPGVPTEAIHKLATDLIDEEYGEVMDAFVDTTDAAVWFQSPQQKAGLTHLADALCDLVYVCVWAGLAYGIPLEACMDEVQRSNMAKFGPGARKDPLTGKQLKPLGWTPPRLEEILFPEEQAQ